MGGGGRRAENHWWIPEAGPTGPTAKGGGKGSRASGFPSGQWTHHHSKCGTISWEASPREVDLWIRSTARVMQSCIHGISLPTFCLLTLVLSFSPEGISTLRVPAQRSVWKSRWRHASRCKGGRDRGCHGDRCSPPVWLPMDSGPEPPSGWLVAGSRLWRQALLDLIRTSGGAERISCPRQGGVTEPGPGQCLPEPLTLGHLGLHSQLCTCWHLISNYLASRAFPCCALLENILSVCPYTGAYFMYLSKYWRFLVFVL